MTLNQVPMFHDLPADEKSATKERKVNDLQESILWLMEKKKLSLAEIQKGAGIPWTTLYEWHNGVVDCQKADKNLFNLWQFLRVPLEFLLFGVGDDDETIDVDAKVRMREIRMRAIFAEREVRKLRKEVESLKLFISAHIGKAS